MLWGLAWYWYAVIIGLLLPWVTMYRDMRDNFDDGFIWGLKICLAVSAVAGSAVLVLGFLLRWYFGKI
jgi:hypothetical protein